MRISDVTFYDLARRNLGEARSNYASAQERALSNQRVSKLSEDPVAISAARMEKSREVAEEANLRSSNVGYAALQIADSSLNDFGEVLQQARERALQALSDTFSAEDRARAAAEIDAMRDSLVRIANARSGDSFVFAGQKDGEAPFAADGSFKGDTNVRELEVLPGVSLPVGISAKVFGVGGAGVDPFAEMQNLSASLRANDKVTLRSSVGNLDTARRQVLDGRAQIGAQTEAFEVTQSVVQRRQDSAKEAQTSWVGISQVDALLDLNRTQQALTDAVQIASQLPLPGLASRR